MCFYILSPKSLHQTRIRLVKRVAFNEQLYVRSVESWFGAWLAARTITNHGVVKVSSDHWEWEIQQRSGCITVLEQINVTMEGSENEDQNFKIGDDTEPAQVNG